MHNVEIAWILNEIADLTELKGENPFKARAFKKVARILQRYPIKLSALPKDALINHINQLPGVGKVISSLIKEILDTGTSATLEELQRQIPRELRQFLAVPGLGASKVGTIYRELKITSLDELEKACKKRLIRQLPGMGSKTEQTILRGIKMLRQGGGSTPIGLALAIGQEFNDFFAPLAEVNQVALTGETRRGVEMVGQINLLVSTSQPKDILEIVNSHPLLKEVDITGENRVRALTWLGATVEFELVEEEEFYPTLFYKTGSKEHWEKIKKLLSKEGILLEDKKILTAQGERIIIKNEHDIYSMAKIPYIPSELRENNGEIERALENNLPKLITDKEIKGDLHIHSSWSDGVNTIPEIVEKAIALDYQYIAITDHSKSLGIARGLQEDRLLKQHQEIREMNKNNPDFKILTGIEMDILGDGRLDYNDEIIREIDVVVASIHSGFNQSREAITERMINAIKNEHVDIVAHPTGRLLGRRDAYEVNLEAVLEAALKYNTALEINSSPDRLDLNAYWTRKAKEMGIKIAINTDAHDVNRMEEIKYGISVGRKAWLEPEGVLNCLALEDLMAYLNK